MEKLNQIINHVYDTGKMPKGFQLSSFRILEDVYVALLLHQPAEFIQSEIADLLSKCNIKVQPHGTGWIAYVN